MSIKRRTRFNRYDSVIVYSENEIYNMYIDEGKSPEYARKHSKKISRELGNLASNEMRMWKRARDNEITAGINPDIHTLIT